MCVALRCLRAQKSGTKWSAAIETQLCYEIKTFLLAGHETSAAMLMWSVYELGRNEQARQKVSHGARLSAAACRVVRLVAPGQPAQGVCVAAARQEQRLWSDCSW